MHGAMDDTTLRNLETRLTYLRNLQQRRDEVKKSIENQGKLSPGAVRGNRCRRYHDGGGGPVPAI